MRIDSLWTLSIAVPALVSFTAGLASETIAQTPAFPARGNGSVTIRRAEDFGSSARNRDEQYAQIAQEVELLERQNSLLKKVVRLVSPTVVHIEAIKEEVVNERGAAAARVAGGGVPRIPAPAGWARDASGAGQAGA